MLVFLSANYDIDSLNTLQHAIVKAQLNLQCLSINCATCPHSEPCADLFRLERYIDRKIRTMEADADE